MNNIWGNYHVMKHRDLRVQKRDRVTVRAWIAWIPEAEAPDRVEFSISRKRSRPREGQHCRQYSHPRSLRRRRNCRSKRKDIINSHIWMCSDRPTLQNYIILALTVTSAEISYLIAYLCLIIRIIMIYEALSLFGIFRDTLVGPQLLQISIAVVKPTAIVESVREFVSEDRADSSIIQCSAK